MVSDSVSKKFGIEKSIGFGIEIIWYRKKYRIRYRKNLVSEKVSDSVSFRFWVSPHTVSCHQATVQAPPPATSPACSLDFCLLLLKAHHLPAQLASVSCCSKLIKKAKGWDSDDCTTLSKGEKTTLKANDVELLSGQQLIPWKSLLLCSMCVMLSTELSRNPGFTWNFFYFALKMRFWLDSNYSKCPCN